MTDLLIQDMDDHVINSLAAQAAVQGTSVENYTKKILTTTATSPKRLSRAELIQKAEEFRKKVGPQKTDSTQLIREDRDNR